jgi:hypothetical protein
MRQEIKLFYLLIAPAIALHLGCSSSSSGGAPTSSPVSNVMPLGAALAGATLAGPLAGKQLYLLAAPVNPSECWVDSEYWSGSELFFAISSVDYTALTNGSYTYNSACNPVPGFSPQSSPGVTGNFNIYRALVTGSQWVLTNLPLNVAQITALGAPKLNGNQMVFVKYEKASGNGNIYLTTRTGDNTYTTPVAFSQNSANCNDDNPTLFNSGNQMIFTSSRTIANGSTCSGTAKKTFWSSTYNGTSWSTPVAITGAPAGATDSVDQAWVDGTNSTLYWTAGGDDCTGSPEICVKMTTGSGTNWPGTPVQIATPVSVTAWPLTGQPFVSLIGQFTISNGYAFTACGVTTYVGSSASSGLTTLNGVSVSGGANSPSPPYYYYHTDIKACVIPL